MTTYTVGTSAVYTVARHGAKPIAAAVEPTVQSHHGQGTWSDGIGSCTVSGHVTSATRNSSAQRIWASCATGRMNTDAPMNRNDAASPLAMTGPHTGSRYGSWLRTAGAVLAPKPSAATAMR